MEWYCSTCSAVVRAAVAGVMPDGWGIRQSPMPEFVQQLHKGPRDNLVGGSPVCAACATTADLAFREEVLAEIAAGQELTVATVVSNAASTDTTDYKTRLKFVCPFCKNDVHVVDDAATGEPALIHVATPCSKFLNLEPTDYMRAVNRERAKTAPS